MIVSDIKCYKWHNVIKDINAINDINDIVNAISDINDIIYLYTDITYISM